METRRTTPKSVKRSVLRKTPRQFLGSLVLLLAVCGSALAQLPSCYAGFEISQACITDRGLHQKVAAYQRKIDQAMPQLGASYKISLRPVNNPADAGYSTETGADVFTDIVRNEEMRPQAFIINVTADFLEKQPEILFEASALHEVCHVMNDDLTGYHRNGINIEVAEEHCVLQAIGESRYEEYLRAYATYRHWDSITYERFLQTVKNVVLAPSPSERDEADRIAEDYFRTHADGHEHFLVYNGELHDLTQDPAKANGRHDPEKLNAFIQAGKPMIFFHNHPSEGRAAMFPSSAEFGEAGLLSFIVYRKDPNLAVEFRIMHLGEESTIVSYGFKGTALEDIKKLAHAYQNALSRKADLAQLQIRQTLLDDDLARDSFNQYLRYACPEVLPRLDAEGCRTNPQYFIWPSDRFFIHYRPQ
jgi:hypothetical protein